MEKAAYFTVSEGSKLGATATRVSRGSGAALGADSTSKFSRAVSSRTKTQEMALIAGWLEYRLYMWTYGGQRSLWLCRCLDGRLLVEEGGGGGRERTEEATWRRRREEGGRERGTFGTEGRCGDGARCFKSGRFACAEEN